MQPSVHVQAGVRPLHGLQAVCPPRARQFAPRCKVWRAAEERREIGCSELYNMVDTINNASTTTSPQPATQSSPASAQPSGPAQQQPGTTAKAKGYGADYYKGLVTTDLAVDNKASSADMLKRSLQFAGGSALLLTALVLGFLASNGLL